MKNIILFGLFILSLQCYTQTLTPMHSDTLWFRDAIGNMDSVIICSDPRGSTEIDPEFGEVALTHPFDSIFDVRVTQLTSRFVLTKRYIGLAEKILGHPKECFSGGDFQIFMVAKHQPITISWNRKGFENSSCKNGSFITNHIDDFVVWPYDWEKNDTFFQCMSIVDSLIVDSSVPFLQDAIEIEWEIAGKGKQTLYGLRVEILPAPYWGPCNALVSTENSDITSTNLSVFPNPTNHILNINNDFPKKVNIYDLQGKLVLKAANTSKIDVSQLVSGIYFLEVYDRNSSRQVTKFIKM